MYACMAFAAAAAWFTAMYVCIVNFPPLNEAFDELG